MDQWNYTPDNFPQDNTEPTPPETAPEQPTEVPAEQPSVVEPTPHVEAAVDRPTDTEPTVPTRPSTPPSYNPYGWNPYTTPPSSEPPKPPKKSRTGLVIGVIGGVCAVIIVALSVLLVLSQGGFDLNLPEPPGASDNGDDDRTDVPTLEITELDEDAQGLSTRDIVKQNIDSTVLLTMYTTVSDNYHSGFPFSEQGTEREVEAGSATGIVMSADGYIITNWHCVVDETTGEPLPRVDVKLYNGTVYERATFIGADQSTDLAVIKVNATDLQPADFGDSSILQLGDKVVALGNAGGMGWSATQGIVSGLERDVYEDTGYAIKCLQVDATINPGNSGGPLFNAAGQVIAVNSAKIVAEGYEGIGFSIPINEAKTVINELLKSGYVTGRVALGITGQTYSDAYYNGFLIYTIEDGSPLKHTSAQKGDLIVGVDDQEVTDYATLRSALAQHEVGDTVTLHLLRSTNRKVESFSITIELIESKQ